MNEEQRPGGLTALAVINLVLAGWGILGLLGFAATYAFRDRIPVGEMQEAQQAQMEAFREMGLSVFVMLLAGGLIVRLLLLVAGIGYLKQKKILGRMVGNTYAVAGIIYSIASAMAFRAEVGGGFNISTMIGLIYPVVTLFLLNVTFRDDFTS